MLKKTIEYTDFNGDKVSEDFFFHLSQAELVELELSHDGGLSESLKKIIADEDGGAIVTEFKNIILKSYGKKSEDGKRFIKNEQLREEFESSEAYSTLFMELISDGDKAAAFVNGVVPAEAAEQAAAQLAAAGSSPAPAEKRIVDPSELNNMSPQDFAKLKEEINAGKAMIQSNKG